MSSQAPVVISTSPSLPSEGEVLIDKFLVERRLGEGGMCVVYAARHLQLEGQVAIKLLRPDVISEAANPEELVQRFLREGVAASQIKSEHVVRTFDVGTLPSGDPFLVMEYLDGQDLDALLREHGPLPVDAAVDYVLQAGEAIAEAHGLGIIHRDLKPANLFLTQRPDGSPFVKVLDFGISKIVRTKNARKFDPALTGTANVLGSPHYMSPEQLRASRDVDARTDIWSLGAILHELLSGEPPFKGNTMPEICANILKDPPPMLAPLRPEVPPALQGVVLRCLEKDPARRFQSVAELASALAEFATAAGRASAQRIIGVARTFGGDAIADLYMPPHHDGPTWGSTDPTFDDIQVVVPVRRGGRVLGLAVFAVLMAAVGALLAIEISGPDRVADWFDTYVLHRAPEHAAAAPAPLDTTPAPAPLATGEAPPSIAPAPSIPPPPSTAEPATTPAPTDPARAPAASDDGGQRAAPARSGRGRSRAPSHAPRAESPYAAPSVPSVPSAPEPSPAPTDDTLFEERK